jgi:hypothetical protein
MPAAEPASIVTMADDPGAMPDMPKSMDAGSRPA